jgi:hypothetical protein
MNFAHTFIIGLPLFDQPLALVSFRRPVADPVMQRAAPEAFRVTAPTPA